MSKIKGFTWGGQTKAQKDAAKVERSRLKAKLLSELDEAGVGRDTYYHITDVKLRELIERVFKEGA